MPCPCYESLCRKLKGHDLPANIAMKAPKFCSVYVISKGRLASVHARTTSAQDSSSCGDTRNHSTCSSEDTVLSRGIATLFSKTVSLWCHELFCECTHFWHISCQQLCFGQFQVSCMLCQWCLKYFSSHFTFHNKIQVKQVIGFIRVVRNNCYLPTQIQFSQLDRLIQFPQNYKLTY